MQQRHLNTKRVGRAYPRVHALVYSVSDGILKELELDEPGMFKKYSSVYNLFPEAVNKTKGDPTRRVALEPMLNDSKGDESVGNLRVGKAGKGKDKSGGSSSLNEETCAKTGCDCGKRH